MLQDFKQLYGNAGEIRVFRAPGRVNLIGEHTDYNLGFVLPMALHLATYVAVSAPQDGRLRIHSEDRNETREWALNELGHLGKRGDWTDYPIGVARELISAGFEVTPANLLIRSTVPEGSGLSSSAALEVSSALALLRGQSVDRKELARLCQRAENNFVGIPSGIMDQFASVFGEEHAAIQLDCRSLDHRLVQLPGGVEFVAVNSMVKHALAGSAYHDRVRECASAVAHIQREHPSVASLRDISIEQFEIVAGTLPPVIARRARHVVSENARVEEFVEACGAGDLEQMGKSLVESHRSLQHDYEVSCAELDFLVDTALSTEGVYGARMTGGGFGGCIVAMIQAGTSECFEKQIAQAYHQEFHLNPQMYLCRPSGGAAEVRNFETIPPKS